MQNGYNLRIVGGKVIAYHPTHEGAFSLACVLAVALGKTIETKPEAALTRPCCWDGKPCDCPDTGGCPRRFTPPR